MRDVKVQVPQSCPTLFHPMDYTVHGILQARTLECTAIPFSKGSSSAQGLNPGLQCRQILYLSISSPGHPVTPRRLPSDVGRGASSTEERPSSWLVLSECPLVSRAHRTGAGEVGDADVASAFADFKLEMGRRLST